MSHINPPPAPPAGLDELLNELRRCERIDEGLRADIVTLEIQKLFAAFSRPDREGDASIGPRVAALLADPDVPLTPTVLALAYLGMGHHVPEPRASEILRALRPVAAAPGGTDG